MSNPPVWIRNFCPEDFESLFLIDQTCFEPGIAFSRGEFAVYLSNPRAIARVVEESGQIIGFAIARLDHSRAAHVITLDVAFDHRRRGIGTLLMKDLHREFEKKKVRVSILEVGVQNTPAQSLYRKLGYKVVDILNGYYRGRENAYRMKLVLGSLL